MKKVLMVIYSIVVVFCVGYGIPLTIVNIGKEAFLPYLIISIIGVILLCIGALFITFKNKDKK